MTSISMFCFPMRGRVAAETIGGLHYADIITPKSIGGLGRTARSVVILFKPKYMFGTGPTNTTLKNSRTHPPTNRRNVQPVELSSILVKTVIPCWAINFGVRPVAGKRCRKHTMPKVRGTPLGVDLLPLHLPWVPYKNFIVFKSFSDKI